MVTEIERSVAAGHRGVNLPGETPRGLPPLTDQMWDPIWDACQQLGIPAHFHGSAGIHSGMALKQWSGYDASEPLVVFGHYWLIATGKPERLACNQPRD